MTPQRVTPKVILVLRWVARIWSLFLLALLLLIAVLPDPNAVAPVPLSDWVVLGLLVGGALGNVIDRLLYGAVADFLNVTCCGIANPWSFNIADIGVFAGAIGLALFTGPSQRQNTP